MRVLHRKKWDAAALLLITVALYTVTTLSYTLWPAAVSPNRVLGFFLFLEILVFYFYTLRRRDLPVLALCAFISMVSFVLCGDLAQNLTDATYFAATVLLLWKLSDFWASCRLYRALKALRGLLCAVVAVGNLLLVIGFCVPACYVQLWGVWQYYQGFTPSTHTLCAGVCLLLALTLFLLRDAVFRLWHPLCLLPGLAAIAMSGARTYLVSVLVLVALYILYEMPQVKLRFALLPALLIGAVCFVLFSGMTAKLAFLRESAALSDAVLAQLTSGRTEFWVLDLDAFLRFDFFHLLFGQGFDYPYWLNETSYGVRIWAHNDVLDLLLGAGVWGTLLYGYVLFASFWTLFHRTTGWLLPVLLTTYVLFALLVNGFFGYQHYVYSFFVLALTFMGAPEEAKGEEGAYGGGECDCAGV